MRTTEPADVRPSPIAGRWYPGDPVSLAHSIDEMLSAAPSLELTGEVVGLVVPHAGYRYSGTTAARAFKAVEGLSFARVIIISPMHHPYPGAILTSDHAAYETPLGKVPVDRVALDRLMDNLAINPVRNDPEHALEIELPFLQRVLRGEFRLVPLMLRDQGLPTARALGDALAALHEPGEQTLLVASSDLSHFYSDAEARALDETMLRHIVAFDPRGVITADRKGEAFACGHGAIAAVLFAARALGADKVTVVGYATSAESSGDYGRVVGYGAAVITRPSQKS